MKFKTIIITKKGLIVFMTVLCLIAACGAYIGLRGGTVAVFSDMSGVSEAAGGLKRLLGLDGSRPERFMDSYAGFLTTPSPTQLPQETPSPSPNAAASPAPSPPAPSITAEAVTQSKGISLDNHTSYKVDINEYSKKPLPFTLTSDGPQVLIMHTHTTESYALTTGRDRSTDENLNTVAVGEVIRSVLERHGISVIHDSTVHDYPSYNGSYTRAASTIKKNLQAYPSLKVVLDVHRDGMTRADGTRLKTSCTVNGSPSAQAMIVASSDAMGLSHPNWRDNLAFAANIQKCAVNMYPGLMRPVQLREERFNEHLTKGSLILEIGSNGNSIEEAKTAASCLAEALSEVLR